MKRYAFFLSCLLFVLLLSNCKKGGSEGPRIYNLGDTISVIEGKIQTVVDTTRMVLNSQTGNYEHPKFTINYVRTKYDNRVWGDSCNFTTTRLVSIEVELSNGRQSVTDSFEYHGCSDLYLGLFPGIKTINMDSVRLYRLRIHPLPDPITFAKMDEPNSLEFVLLRQ